jgi:hypothetical protein
MAPARHRAAVSAPADPCPRPPGTNHRLAGREETTPLLPYGAACSVLSWIVSGSRSAR